jgi:hypothetical protein
MVLLLVVMNLAHPQAMRKFSKIRIKRVLFQCAIVATNFEGFFNAHEMEKKDDKFVDSTIGVHDLLVTLTLFKSLTRLCCYKIKQPTYWASCDNQCSGAIDWHDISVFNGQ